jgi:type IX secretion system PorP/SprF family membrane protein
VKNRPVYLTLVFAIQFLNVSAQNANTPTLFKNYYYDYKIANPAFVGSKSKHLVNTVYSGVPGSSSELVYASYERNIKAINSGVGGMFTYEQLGPWARKHIGVFYAYKLAFSENSGIRFGTQVFYQRRTIDYSYFRLQDTIDPIYSSGTETRANVNFDLGALYYSPVITVGISLKNILKQDFEPFALENQKSTFFTLVASRKFNIVNGLNAEPSLLFSTDFDERRIGVNGLFEIKEWILLGAGFISSGDDEGDINVNVGVNIKDWVQIITHLYSTRNQTEQYESDTFIETMVRVTIPE